MAIENTHPSDGNLLLLADAELSPHLAAEIRGHLAGCRDCQARFNRIESTLTEFSQVQRKSWDPKLPHISGPRAQLRARLEELAQDRPHSAWESRFNIFALAAVAVCILAGILGVRYLHWQSTTRGELISFESLPDSHLTPGATTTAGLNNICSVAHDDVDRAVPSSLRQTVFQEYGIRQPPANYEVDFLISPGLGGAQDVRNLWPEARYNIEWNSSVKDQLEDFLHQSVCAGKISLADAQQEIARNWISAYKKHFHTEKPLQRFDNTVTNRRTAS